MRNIRLNKVGTPAVFAWAHFGKAYQLCFPEAAEGNVTSNMTMEDSFFVVCDEVIYTTTIRIKLLYKLALLVHEHAYS
jgi:hypothetical protein